MRLFFILGVTLFVGAKSVAQENPFSIKWDNGFKLQSADKNFKLQFGGRIMWDNAFFFQDDVLEEKYGKLQNGNEFRRARFYSSGTIYNNIDFKLQLDFTGGVTTFKDVFITIKGISVLGNLKVGHFKEPFRLEALTSSKYITFMERALPIDFVPERNAGFMFYNDVHNKRFSWQGGIFRRSDKFGNNKEANDGFAFTFRFTGLPLVNEDKSKLLHVGMAYSYRNPESMEYKISSRPEAHLGNKYVSTGTIEDVSKIGMFNIEAALVLGSFSVQGEFLQSTVSFQDVNFDNVSFNSYYAEVSYFLTGENRKYKSSLAGFDRVKPKNNFGSSDHNSGAWQIALRYSAIDLNSGDLNFSGIEGGQQSDISLGLNWYLNPATRIMFNYILAHVKDEGDASILQTRFQIDF